MMSVDVLIACAVLQDHADQLSVLGNIIRPETETVSNIITLTSISELFSVDRTAICNVTTVYTAVQKVLLCLPALSEKKKKKATCNLLLGIQQLVAEAVPLKG